MRGFVRWVTLGFRNDSPWASVHINLFRIYLLVFASVVAAFWSCFPSLAVWAGGLVWALVVLRDHLVGQLFC